MKLIYKSILLTFGALVAALFVSAPVANAATSPTLTAAASYSVLGGAAVTCIGSTTTTGDVGVSPGASLTGFPVPCIAGPPGTTNINDASAIAAQADRLVAYGVLDAGDNADANCIGGIYPSGTDLTTLSPLVPGVYCSAGSFLLTGNLTLTGSTGVWVFKTVSTLVTSPGASVTGGDACNVWWRIGSAATLNTTTSFLGNIVTGDVADTTALMTGATLNGRVLGGDAQTVTLDANTITGPTCAGGGGGGSNGGSGTTPGLPSTGTESASTTQWVVLGSIGALALLGSILIVRKRKTS